MSVKAAKKTADDWFSKYIRLKAVKELREKTGGNNDYAQCVSCGKVDHWKEMDAGHWINRRHNIVRYDESNVHCQCQYCNRFCEGNASGYALFMLSRYGSEIMDDLDELHHQPKQFKEIGLREIAKEYRLKTKSLALELGISL